ncbi:hypothetical protein VB712_04835 [Spirulina sp. CCNP1310]|uniref:hypothetical protein n=1 Tax=Spirulina sp. CCNP1310 TaxID=3110249 RepID=UPI002B208DCB|nr:hypothetical protein [Spirulina sp. CCNP1310]MEA5418542.1 hypothetical protein [Spirulina sp. CCNP1310]
MPTATISSATIATLTGPIATFPTIGSKIRATAAASKTETTAATAAAGICTRTTASSTSQIAYLSNCWCICTITSQSTHAPKSPTATTTATPKIS